MQHIENTFYFFKQIKYNTKFGENERGQIQAAMTYCTLSGTKPPHRDSKYKFQIQPDVTNILKSDDERERERKKTNQ